MNKVKGFLILEKEILRQRDGQRGVRKKLGDKLSVISIDQQM